MLHYHIKNQYFINCMKKILALLFLFSLNVFSQEIMNESEITNFLNSNVEGIKIEMENEFMNVKYKTNHLFSVVSKKLKVDFGGLFLIYLDKPLISN